MAPAVDATARRDKHLFRLAYGVLALAFWVSLGGLRRAARAAEPLEAARLVDLAAEDTRA